jgi:hypothetical protein
MLLMICSRRQQDRFSEVSSNSKKDDTADPSLGVSPGQDHEAMLEQSHPSPQLDTNAKFQVSTRVTMRCKVRPNWQISFSDVNGRNCHEIAHQQQNQSCQLPVQN